MGPCLIGIEVKFPQKLGLAELFRSLALSPAGTWTEQGPDSTGLLGTTSLVSPTLSPLLSQPFQHGPQAPAAATMHGCAHVCKKDEH